MTEQLHSRLCMCINLELFMYKLAIIHINMLLTFHYTHVHICMVMGYLFHYVLLFLNNRKLP